MTLTLYGVTSDGTSVPIEVTDDGKLVIDTSGVSGYVEVSGDNMTGDLTLGTDKITLDATDGSATFESAITLGDGLDATDGAYLYPGSLSVRGDSLTNENSAFTVFRGGREPEDRTCTIRQDGNATFNGDVQIGGAGVGGAAAGIYLDNSGLVQAARVSSNTAVFRGYTAGNSSETSKINADGSATFNGDVVIGSKGSNWLIRESNGVAMLVEQNLRQPIEEKVRDLPNELDLIEAVLNEIMDKLRMTPPAGWPVWDGSDIP